VDGVCSCGDPLCGCPGKHPLTSHGISDASTNPTIVKWWYKRWPTANIAIATGAASGLLVVDVDYKSGGLNSLAHLTQAYGPLNTAKVRTGGGLHFYYRHVDGIGNKVGIAGGIDVRSTGGYVCAPPSIHYSGKHYSWLVPPSEDTIKEAPDWLLRRILESNAMSTDTDYSEYKIPNGRRNGAMFYFASSLRARGLSLDAIEAALLVENEKRCDPPLPEDEVIRIIQSVAKYPSEDKMGICF